MKRKYSIIDLNLFDNFLSVFSACKLMAKQKVALECLSYHATANQEQTVKLINDVIQPAEAFKLYRFDFTGNYF